VLLRFSHDTAKSAQGMQALRAFRSTVSERTC